MRWVAAVFLLTAGIAEAQTTLYFKRDHVYAGPGGGEIAIITPAPSDTAAPGVPTGVGTSSVTATSVVVSWTGSTDSGGSLLAGYKVYRQKGSGASLPVGTVASGTTTFTDQPLEPSTSYTWTAAPATTAAVRPAAPARFTPVTPITSKAT
jgi:hypothetical protein